MFTTLSTHTHLNIHYSPSEREEENMGREDWIQRYNTFGVHHVFRPTKVILVQQSLLPCNQEVVIPTPFNQYIKKFHGRSIIDAPPHQWTSKSIF